MVLCLHTLHAYRYHSLKILGLVVPMRIEDIDYSER